MGLLRPSPERGRPRGGPGSLSADTQRKPWVEQLYSEYSRRQALGQGVGVTRRKGKEERPEWGRSAPASRELPVPGGWGHSEEGARPPRFSNTLNPSERFLHLTIVFKGLYGFLKD